MIQFYFPELFLLAIPLWFVFRRWGRVSGTTGWLRLALLVLLLLALTGPRLNVGGQGIDVVVVADRSRSMPTMAHANIRELIENLEHNVGAGDRVALVTFGSDPQVEHELSGTVVQGEYAHPVSPDGSDLNAAVLTALERVDADRPARILLLSDGEANGPSPLGAARRAREQGVPIDYRLFERIQVGDAAVESVLLPETVAPREPFQFSVWVYADKETSGEVTVFRDETQISRVQRELHSGMNRLLFRDILEEGGTRNYTVRLTVADDPILENNTGAGIVRVDAGPRLLVLSSDGVEGNLAGALRAGQVPFDVAVAKNHALTQDSLDRYRAVIIENVPARDLGRLKMERLAQFVEDLGGGLMLTGGQRSFGTGGYFKSPLDETLPVSMEMREEHRKNRLALAVALDRSGSMAVGVQGGKTKMDLANLGTAECVRLLSPGDSVAVIAVDSSPHIIQELTDVDDPEPIARRALQIESLGGGIFIYEALVAAGKQILQAEQTTKHIILFADAADSEEPGGYKALLEKFDGAGITVSVIGLGTELDTDADLLKDIAKRGNGNIMFTEDPEELPRLFTEDTMSVARSTFVEKDPTSQPGGIPGQLLPDARLMGNLSSGAFPSADGYNLSYMKPEATAAVLSADEYLAPWSAFWYRGLGRAAALTLEVDGQFSGDFGKWENYDDFLITHARWLLGGDSPTDAFTTIQRDGQDAVVTVELDPDRPNPDRSETPTLTVVPPGQEREAVIQPDFVWTEPDTLQARFRLDRTGTFRTLVKFGHRKFARGPAMTLPYSPEYIPRVGLPSGKDQLAVVSEISGGEERTDVLEVFANQPRSPRMVSLLPWLLVLAVVLLLIEIAGRRLSLWERLSHAVAPSSAATTRRARWLPQWKLRLLKRERPTAEPPETATEDRREPADKLAQAPRADAPSADSPTRSVADVFAQAKSRAKRRMKD